MLVALAAAHYCDVRKFRFAFRGYSATSIQESSIITVKKPRKAKLKGSPVVVSKKPHFSYGPLGGQLDWIVSGKHAYELVPDSKLGLNATAKGILLGAASKLDHFIWDEIVKKRKSTRCDSLTIWTKDIEFNLLLFGTASGPNQLRCAYFAAPDAKMCQEHLKYWGLTIGAAKSNSISNTKLKRAILKKRPSSADGAMVKGLLPQIVVWNRYTKSASSASLNEKFTRYHSFTLDPFREHLQTIPIPTQPLADSKSLTHINNGRQAAQGLYELVLNRYESVTGCGTPMKRNLRNLASLLADPNIRVALVTGEPGTGKENLCKAIYYGNKLYQPSSSEPESIFLETTSVQIQAAMRESTPKSPDKYLENRLLEEIRKLPGGRSKKPNAPVIWIDELNKAEQDFLAAMLRPLEQGKDQLNTIGQPKYILAASQHIDELAKQPPQDFWTRVSHQLRVVHPLSHVSEDDGEAFLSSFFYAQWWSFIEVMVRNYSDKSHAENLVKVFLGEIDSGGALGRSDLCKLVRAVFVNTLVPLVSRDTLSVRGARSILSQAFARLSWHVRFQKPTWNLHSEPDRGEVVQQISSAIQDVMAILNAARATPAGLEDRRLKKDEKR